MSSNGEFPTHWPEQCPPEEALPADGVYYRLVRHNPPQAEDFRTSHEQGTFQRSCPCMRHSLSVFAAFDDAEYNRNLYPK
jgi:hypothetical protein